MAEFRMTGGCQCGAVRYPLLAQPPNPHICHCRMCQKAFGSFFAPLTGVTRDNFEVTRGAFSFFRSSDQVERGFCSACGTPLSFGYVGAEWISVSIGSLDDPAAVAPTAASSRTGRRTSARQAPTAWSTRRTTAPSCRSCNLAPTVCSGPVTMSRRRSSA